ncbi:hypothetical protein TWF481_002892 [Arthrobotrys musiformis]|uniref:PX-associated domain-containing protein n=1 Tax=Arthrobotrys musiformis TaxID=47236 RepID=A0AAV9VUF3_9PEZI
MMRVSGDGDDGDDSSNAATDRKQDKGKQSEPKENKTVSKSPLLQLLFSTFVVPIPGLKDISQDFWTKRVQPLIDDLAKANLSESYDKGSMGIRKTLATAISALIESKNSNPESQSSKKPKTVLQNSTSPPSSPTQSSYAMTKKTTA